MFQAIIDRDTWERAQLQLKENARLDIRNNKCHEYLLRGMVYCGECCRAYAGTISHGKRKYRCPKYDHVLAGDKPTCHGISITADEAETLVWDAVAKLLKNPDMIKTEYQRKLTENGNTDMTEEQHKIDVEVRKLKNKEERVKDMY